MKKGKEDKEWEGVNNRFYYSEGGFTERMEVPGGWLYKYECHKDKVVSVSMVFVPCSKVIKGLPQK